MKIINLDRSKLYEIKHLWEELNSLHADLSSDFKEYFNNLTFEKRIEALLKKNFLSVFGAVESKTLIGYCISTAEGNTGEIDSIYIKPEYRGQNIGFKLMNKALKWLNNLKTEIIDISVARGNEQVFGFYEKFGFKQRFTILQKRK